MEIERKYLIRYLPEDLMSYPYIGICQGYLNREPVVRVRKEGDAYYLTYKGKGLLVREEYNMPLTEAAYLHLLEKCDGEPIRKIRYTIPYGGLEIVLDEFLNHRPGLKMAEVEFPTEEAAARFVPPDWFGEEVTYDPAYQNVNL